MHKTHSPCKHYMNTRISGRYAPFILGLPAGFPRAHARAHFVRFPCRARRGSCCSLHMTHMHGLYFLTSHDRHSHICWLSFVFFYEAFTLGYNFRKKSLYPYQECSVICETKSPCLSLSFKHYSIVSLFAITIHIVLARKI